jgi:hypothetical protein
VQPLPDSDSDDFGDADSDSAQSCCSTPYSTTDPAAPPLSPAGEAAACLHELSLHPTATELSEDMANAQLVSVTLFVTHLGMLSSVLRTASPSKLQAHCSQLAVKAQSEVRRVTPARRVTYWRVTFTFNVRLLFICVHYTDSSCVHACLYTCFVCVLHFYSLQGGATPTLTADTTATATSTTAAATAATAKRAAETEAGESPLKKADNLTAKEKSLRQLAGSKVVIYDEQQWQKRDVADVCAEKGVICVYVSTMHCCTFKHTLVAVAFVAL